MYVSVIDYMWLHIRAVGEWTNKLYEYFEREQQKLHNGDIPMHTSTQTEKKRLSNGSISSNSQNPIKKIQATITRTFSNRDPNKKEGAQLIGYTNETFKSDNENNSLPTGDIEGYASSSAGFYLKIFLE